MTGLIYAAIAVAWLAYLIPTYLRKRDQETEEVTDPRNRFSDSVRIVRSGTAPILDQDLSPIEKIEISTPMTRRAAIADLRRLETQAAQRRRRVLLILLAVVSLVLGVCGAGLVPFVWLAVPGGLLLAFVVVSRVSVRLMQKGLDARFDAICHGNDEKTVYLSRSELKGADLSKAGQGSGTEPLAAGTTQRPGGLWDPLPITLPTYVSKPLAPRTVRTIDLSAPDVSSSGRQELPVTADAQPVTRPQVVPEPSALEAADQAVEADELRRAVGE